jgi:hypothetical protein
MFGLQGSADPTEDELEIPLDCVVASVGQSPRLIRLGGELSIPQKGDSFSETKALHLRRHRDLLRESFEAKDEKKDFFCDDDDDDGERGREH